MTNSELATKCAEAATEEAQAAHDHGTFGVGGLIIDDNGKILKKIENRVIVYHDVVDPTGHGERQLVDWYFGQKATTDLPPPEKMTIITSLDPCVMCAGAILTGGFNVIHISQDEESGVSYIKRGDFSTMVPYLRIKAKETFSSFGFKGGTHFTGPTNSIFFEDDIEEKFDTLCKKAFCSNLDEVKQIMHDNQGLHPNELKNPKNGLPPDILAILKALNDKVFTDEYTVNFDKPGIKLGRILVPKAQNGHEGGGDFNSSCIIDPFGNVLLAFSGNQSLSPAKTAYMVLTRHYRTMLHNMGDGGIPYFAHPRYCKMVLLWGPGVDSKSFMEMGAFGSTMEEKLPPDSRDQLQYCVPKMDPSEVYGMLTLLPPLYSTEIKMQDAVKEVEDEDLRKYCKDATSRYPPPA